MGEGGKKGGKGKKKRGKEGGRGGILTTWRPIVLSEIGKRGKGKKEERRGNRKRGKRRLRRTQDSRLGGDEFFLDCVLLNLLNVAHRVVQHLVGCVCVCVCVCVKKYVYIIIYMCVSTHT